MGNQQSSPVLRVGDKVSFDMKFKYHRYGMDKVLSDKDLDKFIKSSSFTRVLNSYIEPGVLVYLMPRDGMMVKLGIKQKDISKVKVKNGNIVISVDTTVMKSNGKKEMTSESLLEIYSYSIKHYLTGGGILGQVKKYENSGDLSFEGFHKVRVNRV